MMVECADLWIGDRLVSTLDHKLEPEVKTVRRLEVITGAGRRRWFTEDFKARVVEETLAAGVVVSEVDRRHGLTPQANRGRIARPKVRRHRSWSPNMPITFRFIGRLRS